MAALQLGQVGDLNRITSALSTLADTARAFASASCSAFAAWAWDSISLWAGSKPGFSKAASMVARPLGLPERRSSGFISGWAGSQQPRSPAASMAASASVKAGFGPLWVRWERPMSYTLRSLNSWALPSFQFCTGR